MMPLTNLGLYGDFEVCDKNIIQGLNVNFELLDNLVQLAFNNIVSELPEDPVEGDKYILFSDNSIQFFNGTEWIMYPAQEGYIGYNKGDGLIYFYDGINWNSFPASAISFDNTGTGLSAVTLQAAIVELKSLNDLTNTNLADGLAEKADVEHTHILSDILQSGASLNEIPQWNGTNWVPKSVDEFAYTDGIPNTGFLNVVLYTTIYEEISSNTTYFFSTLVQGKSVSVILKNIGASSIDITFPAGLIARPDITFTIETGKYNVYTFLFSANKVFVACVDGMEE